MGIKSFRHKGLEEFFLTGSKRGIQPEHARKLADILDRRVIFRFVNGDAYVIAYVDYH